MKTLTVNEAEFQEIVTTLAGKWADLAVRCVAADADINPAFKVRNREKAIRAANSRRVVLAKILARHIDGDLPTVDSETFLLPLKRLDADGPEKVKVVWAKAAEEMKRLQAAVVAQAD